jgi:hypothetical protein
MAAVDCIWLAADLNWIPAPSLHGTAFQEQQNRSDCRCTNRCYRMRSLGIRITKCVRQAIYLWFLVGFRWLRAEEWHVPVRTAMNLRVPYKGENFFKSWATTSFLILNLFSATANWLVTRSRLLGCKYLHSLISAKIYLVSHLWLVVPNVTASYGLQKPRGVEWHRSTPCISTECF